jgi:DNA-binding protein HU-beta
MDKIKPGHTRSIRKIVRDETGVDRETVKVVIDSFMRAVMDEVITGKTLHLKGFGTFRIKQKNARRQKILSVQNPLFNPREPFKYEMKPAYCFPVFIPGKEFKEEVRKNIKPKLKP